MSRGRAISGSTRSARRAACAAAVAAGAWIHLALACSEDDGERACVGRLCEADCYIKDEKESPRPYDCTDGAECTVHCGYEGRVVCEGSKCDVIGDSDTWCRDGSTCSISCTNQFVAEALAGSRAALVIACNHLCDESTCNVACAGACSTVCRAGSTCAVDCLFDTCAMTCEAGSTCTQRCAREGEPPEGESEGTCYLCCEAGAECDLDCPAGLAPLDCGAGGMACGSCTGRCPEARWIVEDLEFEGR